MLRPWVVSEFVSPVGVEWRRLHFVWCCNVGFVVVGMRGEGEKTANNGDEEENHEEGTSDGGFSDGFNPGRAGLWFDVENGMLILARFIRVTLERGVEETLFLVGFCWLATPSRGIGM